MGTSAVITAGPKKGSLCLIQGFNAVTGDVIVEVPDRPKEPPFGYTIANSIKEKYYDTPTAASATGLNPGLLGFVTGEWAV